jgi:thiamine-monophosphate kinase
MDVSDGLIKDLERMLKGSGLSGHLRAASVPLSEPARKVIAREPDRLASLLTAGDDYEVLTAVPAPLRDTLRSAATAAGIPLTEVGTVASSPWPLAGPGLTVEGPDGHSMTFPRPGWVHF